MYVELHAASAFSFLQGASLPEALVDRAAELGYPALQIVNAATLPAALNRPALVAPDGKTYVLELTDENTISVSRETINAVSAAACLAVGIGGSALGAYALVVAIRGPHPLQQAPGKPFRGPRLVVLDNVYALGRPGGRRLDEATPPFAKSLRPVLPALHGLTDLTDGIEPAPARLTSIAARLSTAKENFLDDRRALLGPSLTVLRL